MKAIEQSIAREQLNNKVITNGTYTVMSDGNICLVALTNGTCSKEDTLEVSIDGEHPSSGTITLKGGVITNTNLIYENITITTGKDNSLVYNDGIILAPGLYDEDDNLLISWYDLTSTEYQAITYYDENSEEVVGSILNVDENGGLTATYDYSTYENKSASYLEGKLIIDNSVTSIGYRAFWKCTGLTSIIISESVTTIGNLAFSYCSSLTSIIVDEKNQVYDSRNNSNAVIETSTNTLVVGCQSTIIPDSVTSIGEYAFAYTNLTSITIPESVTTIGNSAFLWCKNLTSIIIPDSVTRVGEHAFASCTGLTNVTIGSSVTSIGVQAFSNCTSLTSITIPDSVINIGTRAFVSCKGLTSVTIGSSVRYIGTEAFAECQNLTNVTMGLSITNIGPRAFMGCGRLTSIYIPSSVVTIEATSYSSSPFYGCSSSLKIYCGASEKKDGWGTYWNYSTSGNILSTAYGISKTSYEANYK